jgi:hypothetical protein
MGRFKFKQAGRWFLLPVLALALSQMAEDWENSSLGSGYRSGSGPAFSGVSPTDNRITHQDAGDMHGTIQSLMKMGECSNSFATYLVPEGEPRVILKLVDTPEGRKRVTFDMDGVGDPNVVEEARECLRAKGMG